MEQPKTVFVGLSGGVDSSVAALRLQQAGYRVVGVFIKVWHPDFLVCNWEQERLDAMRVAAKLGIPFLTCDAEAAYRDEVAQEFIEGYRAGRTPNPDVLCNQAVKFGAFLRFAQSHGADYIATGHYAQITYVADKPQLLRGIDHNKDQSYFLWTLTEEQLQQTLLPVGNSTKDQIRKEAEAAGLLTADKPDSQGICFLGQVDIPEFLSHYTTLNPGAVLNEAGEVVGEHQGALVYTIGQRHGFTLTTHDTARQPHYVTHKDLTANTITVAPERPITNATAQWQLHSIVLPADLPPSITAQIRYRQTPFAVHILDRTADTLALQPTNPTDTPASGQSCVLYSGERCLGGGIIS